MLAFVSLEYFPYPYIQRPQTNWSTHCGFYIYFHFHQKCVTQKHQIPKIFYKEYMGPQWPLLNFNKCRGHFNTHLDRSYFYFYQHQEVKGCTLHRPKALKTRQQKCETGWVQIPVLDHWRESTMRWKQETNATTSYEKERNSEHSENLEVLFPVTLEWRPDMSIDCIHPTSPFLVGAAELILFPNTSFVFVPLPVVHHPHIVYTHTTAAQRDRDVIRWCCAANFETQGGICQTTISCHEQANSR